METIVVVSGYFNPLHRGHVRLLRDARRLGDKLIVILNNDQQQLLKKGKIIMSADERKEVVSAVRYVDEVVLSIDRDRPISETLTNVAKKYSGKRIIFANGGDRSTKKTVPEAGVCEKFGIEMRYGVGGDEKPQSSSNINKALGLE